MRKFIDLAESLLMYGETPIRYDSKPAYMLTYSDHESEAPVFMNPSLNTLIKIVEANRGQARGILYHDGKLLVWDRMNMYHQDVYDQVGLGNDFVTLMIEPKGLYFKSEHENPIPAEDDPYVASFVPIAHSSRLLCRYYESEDFPVWSENWF